MSVVPEIKSPLEEKIVVKPILWTMYHIHAYQGPCRYGQGYALTTEADMEVAQKEYNRFLERIHEAVDPKKVEVLDGSLLHWNEDFVIHDNVWEEALAEDEKVDIYLVCGLRISGYFTVELASRTAKAIAFVPHEASHSPCDDVDMSAHLLAMGRKDVYPCRYMDDFVKAVDVLRVKKILKNLKMMETCSVSLDHLTSIQDILGLVDTLTAIQVITRNQLQKHYSVGLVCTYGVKQLSSRSGLMQVHTDSQQKWMR